jgi:hypothetical protein
MFRADFMTAGGDAPWFSISSSATSEVKYAAECGDSIMNHNA